MEYTEKEKVERIKRILIARIKNIGSLATMKALIKNGLTWTKIKTFLDQDLQVDADQHGIDSQEFLDEEEKTLALKAEKDTY